MRRARRGWQAVDLGRRAFGKLLLSTAAVALAKVLIVTEGRPDLRTAILRGNADRLPGSDGTRGLPRAFG